MEYAPTVQRFQDIACPVSESYGIPLEEHAVPQGVVQVPDEALDLPLAHGCLRQEPTLR
jgi:hypothetical protein